MIAYLTQQKNPDNERLPSDCPWLSWFYNEGEPLPDNAILVTDEEYQTIYDSFKELILIEKDRVTMKKRAEVKNDILGNLAAENKGRIRTGEWTVEDLTSLTQDEQIKAVLDDINSLSFELAQEKIIAITNPLITQEIKNQWIGILQGNLFL